MSLAAWIPFLMLLRREIARFLKVLMQTIITPLVSSCLYLIVFGVSLGSKVNDQHGVKYLAFLIPGLVMMGLMNNAFQNSSSSVVNSKFTGELEDMRVVPLTNQQIIWAMSLASVVRGAVVGLVTYLVGAAFYYLQTGRFLGIAHPFELIFFVVIGGLVFGKLGIATAFWAKSFDQLSIVGAFILLPLTYLGGVFISIDSLGPLWKSLSQLNPLFYFINGIRHAILGVSDVDPLRSVLVSLVALVVFFGIAQMAMTKGNFHRW
jgi:ABC-2 type transport system permease protein